MNLEESNKNDNNYDIIKKMINDVNPLEVSPMEALNILYNLKKQLNEK